MKPFNFIKFGCSSAEKYNDLNIAVISREANKFSETFINNQLDYLEGSIFHIHGTEYPYHYGDIPLSIDEGQGEDRLTAAFKRFFEQHYIDVVLANYATTAFDVMEACMEMQIPLVVHFHGWTVYRTAFVQEHLSQYPKLFEVAHRVIAVSKDMKSRLIGMGAEETKVVYLPCGVDSQKFVPVNKTRNGEHLTCLYVGRFTEKKCPDLVIKAYERVLRSYPNMRLVMVGDGHLLEPAKELVRSLNIEDKVTFTGILPPDEVVKWMQKADIFVQHCATAADGNKEGTPCTLLEACLSSLPVVSTYHAGIPDVIEHGKSGLLANEMDWEQTADHILQLAMDADLANRLGKAARENVVNRFTLDNYIHTLNTILQQAVNEQ